MSKKKKAEPLISALITNRDNKNAEPIWVPLPLSNNTSKELDTLMDKAEALAEGDEYSLVPIHYRSRFNFCPNLSNCFSDVTDTAEELAKLTPQQLDSLDVLSRAFDLNFENIKHFFFYLESLKY